MLCSAKVFLFFCGCLQTQVISMKMICFNEPESLVDRVHHLFGSRARFTKAGLESDKGLTKTKMNSQIILAELEPALMAVLASLSFAMNGN